MKVLKDAGPGREHSCQYYFIHSSDPQPGQPGLGTHALDPGHQSQSRQNIVSEGAGDSGYRALVNICNAVGRLDISVFKHCDLISLSKIHLTSFPP